MAESLIACVTKELKEGYHLEKTSGSSSGGGVFQLIDPQGEVVKEHNLPVRVYDRPQDRRTVVARLRRIGAMKPPARSHNPREEKPVEREPDKDKKTLRAEALEAAREALADKDSRPRERKIAKEFLVLIDDQAAITELARQAVSRLKEITKK